MISSLPPDPEAVRKKLAGSRNAPTLERLAESMQVTPAALSETLGRMLKAGEARVTNKLWYLKGRPLVRPQPVPPRTSPEREKFLRRQGNLF